MNENVSNKDGSNIYYLRCEPPEPFLPQAHNAEINFQELTI
jgi:hypothetical protein